MIIRKFEFKNNYLSLNQSEMHATYSSVGYFDGMETELIDESEFSSVIGVQMETNIGPDGFYEKCDHFTLFGTRESDDLDFWRHDIDMPFIFITCLRLKKRADSLDKITASLEQGFNTNECMLYCYSTFDSSDLLIALRSCSCILGYSIIERLYNKTIAEIEQDDLNGMQKSFTILSVRQSILNSLSSDPSSFSARGWSESISCKLNCIVNRWDQIDSFAIELKNQTQLSSWKRYGVMGSNDIVFMVDNIEIKKLFTLYSDEEIEDSAINAIYMKGLLNHGNYFYKLAFMNVSTEILIHERQIKCAISEYLI